jgi:response regulator RpfG family c-di-GMP phosphodiesterase
MVAKVLNIGHNQAMNYLIKTVLGPLFHLIIVEDVFFGMLMLKQKQDINYVLIDIDYQTKESIDFILHIHSSTIYKKPVFVLLSTSNQKVKELLTEGSVAAYFIKPFNPVDLINRINSIDGLKVSTSLS